GTEGGAPTVLCAHPGNEYDPLWSPDGKHIAFIKEIKGDSFLYRIEMEGNKPAGQPFLIKEGMQNVDLINWTKNGISYDFSLDIRDIYTLNVQPGTGIQAGTPRLLDYSPAGYNLCPVWSYDGKHLAFISYNDKPEVVIMPVNGGETRHYTIPASEFWAPAMHDLRWLPDNSGIGFNLINSMDISTMYHLELATGNWQTWPIPVQEWTRTDWGPDGNSFIYTEWGGEEPGIYQFNIKTEETHQIYKPDTAEAWYSIRGIKYSRDHEKLTFKNKGKGVDVLDLETGECRTISQACWSPTFSPDGEKILAFCPYKKENSVTTGVAVLSLDGEILQQYDIARFFTSGTRIYSPDWSPDGKQLVFSTLFWRMDTYLMKNVLK
ncbi:MAG: PD40 domain-containing protein, partial [Bacteroidetes bacterium]|nr:PD40 domain-containing protein [Bacteroidota bacterium]